MTAREHDRSRRAPRKAAAEAKPRDARRVKVQANLPPKMAWQLRVAAAVEGVTPCILIERWLKEPLRRYQYPPMPDAIKLLCQAEPREAPEEPLARPDGLDVQIPVPGAADAGTGTPGPVPAVVASLAARSDGAGAVLAIGEGLTSSGPSSGPEDGRQGRGERKRTA